MTEAATTGSARPGRRKPRGGARNAATQPDPAPADPAPADPASTDPAPTDPAHTGGATTDPAHTDGATTDPAHTGGATTDPAHTDGATTDPAHTGRPDGKPTGKRAGRSTPDGGRAARDGRSPVVAALSVLWFAATLWFTHGAVVSAISPDLALINAALALPLVVAAALVAAAAVAVLGTGRWRGSRAATRTLAGAAVGLTLGAVAGAPVLVGYGTAPALLSLVIAIAVAGAAGGALAGVPVPAVVIAGAVGSLARFALGLVEGAFNGQLQRIFADDGSPGAQLAAAGRLSLLMALLGGAVAGLAAYFQLRRYERGRRDRGGPHTAGPARALGWPAYLAAGAAPGLLLLVAELATRLGGGPLLRLASASSDADRIALEYVGANRLSTALVVLFTGAVTAIVTHGRTLR